MQLGDDGKGSFMAKISANARTGISTSLNIIENAKEILDGMEHHTITALMEHVVEAMGLEKYFRRVYRRDQDDFSSRQENVLELIAITKEVDDEKSDQHPEEPLPEVNGPAE